MDKKLYIAILEVLAEATAKGLTGVAVFKPEYSSDQEPMISWPDLIVANTDNAMTISALLGNRVDNGL